MWTCIHGDFEANGTKWSTKYLIEVVCFGGRHIYIYIYIYICVGGIYV